MNENNAADWIGVEVIQVCSDAPEYDKHISRRGTVEEAFADEWGRVHCKTKEDGVWCPARLLAPVSDLF